MYSGKHSLVVLVLAILEISLSSSLSAREGENHPPPVPSTPLASAKPRAGGSRDAIGTLAVKSGLSPVSGEYTGLSDGHVSVATSSSQDTHIVSTTPLLATVNTTVNANSTKTVGQYFDNMYKSGTLTRMIYVVMGITSIVVIYFVIRAVRVRTRKSKTKKYGILQTADTDLEMTPLDVGDEEEDMTVFELPSNRK